MFFITCILINNAGATNYYISAKGNDAASNPLLASDYTLRPGSPVIDAGIDAGYTYTGQAPDMGALEFTGGRSNFPAIRRPRTSTSKHN